ncbi:hypothetical protein [Mesorhizobium sp. CAU 1732]|uniref:hypothetical protein n=1 Tax=Mesorhizobium sp. CAU 1732 TaxID=3140358 RepID=UPI003261B874
MKQVLLAVGLLLACAVSTSAADWGSYGNARFGYWIDIPPGFSKVEESENGDGGISVSPDGDTELRIWGSHITEGEFLSEVGLRIDQDKAEGWEITYERKTRRWASWSGRRSERVMYERAIPLCRDQAAYFQIEYDRSDIERNGPVVERLVKSLRSNGECR